MANTSEIATRWLEFIASHPAFPAGDKLRAAFHAGKITRLCDCGCNAFEFSVPDEVNVLPLVKEGNYGSICEMLFDAIDPQSQEKGYIEFLVFTDQRGHFAGIDVDYCGNTYPVPESLIIQEPPFHVRCSIDFAA
jgi:hypothetical protein